MMPPRLKPFDALTDIPRMKATNQTIDALETHSE